MFEMSGVKVQAHCTNSTSETFHDDEWVTVELIVHADTVVSHLVNGEKVLGYEQLTIGGGSVDGTTGEGGHSQAILQAEPQDHQAGLAGDNRLHAVVQFDPLDAVEPFLLHEQGGEFAQFHRFVYLEGPKQRQLLAQLAPQAVCNRPLAQGSQHFPSVPPVEQHVDCL